MNERELLIAELNAAEARLRALLDITDRDLTAAESAEFTRLSGRGEGSVRRLRAEFDEFDERYDAASRADGARRAALFAGSAARNGQTGPENEIPGDRRGVAYGDGRVGGPGQTTYLRERPGGDSYLRDRVASTLYGDFAARDRLQRNSREVMGWQQQRGLTTIDGAGGEFVPPLWMVEQFVPLARAGRPTADVLHHEPLPAGTDTVSVPKVATGTAVAEQTTQNTGIQQTDATTTSVTAAVATLAGGQTVAVQLIEQSPGNVDQMILQDLTLDYATKTDVFVLSNNAANKVGLLNVSGVTAVTYTTGSPTGPLTFGPIGQALSQIATQRLLAANVIVMHPRRWFWLATSLDLQNRPLVVPDGNGGSNTLAQMTSTAGSGVVGRILNVDVVADPNLPTNLGAGTNQDPIIVLRTDDSILYESTPRLEVFRETKADQLSVFLRLYNYVAFTGARYPKSIAVVNGTGLIAPAGF